MQIRLQIRLLLFGGLISLTMAASSLGQVEARQATPEDLQKQELVEVPSPMLLEVPLGASGNRKSLADPGVTGRTYYDTKKFVCDKARVPKVLVMKKPSKKGGLDFEVTPTITTGWPRQDIDVTIAIVAQGKEVAKKVWDDLTVGTDDSVAAKLTALSPVAGFAASTTKYPKAVFSFGPGEFEALFKDGEPKLRLILLDIQE